MKKMNENEDGDNCLSASSHRTDELRKLAKKLPDDVKLTSMLRDFAKVCDGVRNLEAAGLCRDKYKETHDKSYLKKFLKFIDRAAPDFPLSPQDALRLKEGGVDAFPAQGSFTEALKPRIEEINMMMAQLKCAP